MDQQYNKLGGRLSPWGNSETKALSFSADIGSLGSFRIAWSPRQQSRSIAHLVASWSKQGMEERRQYSRFRCQGSAEICAQDGLPQWGGVSDISKSGCYIETATPLSVGYEFLLILHLCDRALSFQATVKTAHPMIGMGVQFKPCSPQDENELEALLERLANSPPIEAVPKLDPPMFPWFRMSGEQAISFVKEVENYFLQNRVLSRDKFLDLRKKVQKK